MNEKRSVKNLTPFPKPPQKVIQKEIEILAAEGHPGSRLEAIYMSSAAVGWKTSHFNPMMVCRELLANFADSTTEMKGIVIQALEAVIRVTGPTPYHLAHALFLSSDKQNKIGAYGEGQKISFRTLLADHQIIPITISGNKAVVVTISEKPVEGTNIQPLIYRFYHIPEEFQGTKLVLINSNPVFQHEFEHGMENFFYRENPIVGQELLVDLVQKIGIYRSKITGGLFYNGMKRGTLPNIDLILTLAEDQTLDQLVYGDRDRRQFGSQIEAVYYNSFAQKIRGNLAAQKALVAEAGPFVWERGHLLIETLAKTMTYGWPPDATREVFGDNKYFARSDEYFDYQRRRAIDAKEREYQKMGFKALPAYMARFGLPKAYDEVLRDEKSHRKLVMSTCQRPPIESEHTAINVLRDFVGKNIPSIARCLKEGLSYHIAKGDVHLNTLRTEGSYHQVFIAESIFASSLAQAVWKFIEAHGVTYQYFSSRDLHEELDVVVKDLIEHSGGVAAFREVWEVACYMISEEKQKALAQTEKAETTPPPATDPGSKAA